MKHCLLLLICGALLTACNDPVEPLLLPPPPPPPPGFVVMGIVEMEDGLPLPGATAELLRGGSFPDLSAVTDSIGRFAFGGISGPATVRVTKSGFTGEARYLEVTEPVFFRLRLARLLPDAILTLGDTISATVQAGAPPCDPTGWDAEAPCRRFHFTAPASGKLLVAITWQGSPEIDAALVHVRGGYVGISVSAGYERVLLDATVVMGQDYELRVNSYYGKQDFKLTAELIH
jgi:hypothetical protein